MKCKTEKVHPPYLHPKHSLGTIYWIEISISNDKLPTLKNNIENYHPVAVLQRPTHSRDNNVFRTLEKTNWKLLPTSLYMHLKHTYPIYAPKTHIFRFDTLIEIFTTWHRRKWTTGAHIGDINFQWLHNLWRNKSALASSQLFNNHI